MDHITVRHIVEAVSGTLLCGDADTELKHISIDSRSMRGADLFVPLIGEKSDAHRFLVQAMDNGAAAALTSEHEAAPEGFHGRGVSDLCIATESSGWWKRNALPSVNGLPRAALNDCFSRG